jgi:hypothetical protein
VENSLIAVVSYSGAHSRIVRIVFHPSGRAFFAAEEEGFIHFWRLLRTEFSLGIRDETAQIDRQRRASRVERLQRIPGMIEDVWLDEKGQYLFAVSSLGSIHRWKVRGLKYQAEISLSKQDLFGLVGVTLKGKPLLVVSGREQRFMVWCRFPGDIPVRSEARGAAVISREPQSPLSDAPVGAAEVGLVARSALFRTPLVYLRVGGNPPLLWAAEKTGNLLTFDAGFLGKSPIWLQQTELCKDAY